MSINLIKIRTDLCTPGTERAVSLVPLSPPVRPLFESSAASCSLKSCYINLLCRLENILYIGLFGQTPNTI